MEIDLLSEPKFFHVDNVHRLTVRLPEDRLALFFHRKYPEMKPDSDLDDGSRSDEGFGCGQRVTQLGHW